MPRHTWLLRLGEWVYVSAVSTYYLPTCLGKTNKEALERLVYPFWYR